jgi:hypothetical protein
MISVAFAKCAKDPERRWRVASWAGHCLFDDMAALAPDDPQVTEALLVAEANHILCLDDEERARNPELVERLEALLKRVVKATLSTTEDSHLLRWHEGLEQEWRESYLHAGTGGSAGGGGEVPQASSQRTARTINAVEHARKIGRSVALEPER